MKAGPLQKGPKIKLTWETQGSLIFQVMLQTAHR